MSKRMLGYVVAGALMASSTVSAAAAVPSAPVSNPWASLSMLSGAAAATTYCGASAALAGAASAVAPGGCVLPQVDPAGAVPVAQTAPPRPIPVPPVEPTGGLYFDPLLLGIGAVALAALIYFVLIKKGGDSPDSPA
jgi:hypothetical protein